MSRRCVITGMGAVTPVGNDVDSFWESIKNGVCGIDFIKQFDTTDFAVKIAGEIKDLDIEKYMHKKELKRNDLFSIFALVAAAQAYEMSGLTEKTVGDPMKFGCVVGSGVGGLQTLQDQIGRMNEKGPDRISPLFIPMLIGNMAAGNIAIKYGAKGVCQSIVTACATGTSSIGEAFRAIKHGYLDVAFAGGAEHAITRAGVAGFTSLTALSKSNDPKDASKPFDKNRGGFVMGDGAGVLILEELEHALARGAKIYGEVVGYGATCDAYHITSPCPDGEGAANAMTMAMEEAGIKPEQVGYINAHGTGTHANDVAETLAIIKAMGDAAYKIPVSSTKSMTGHLLGATGAVEAIACIKAMENSFVPPTIGYTEPDPECNLDYVPNVGRGAEIEYSLSNSLGFGGHNAVLCLKKWEDR